MKAFKCDVCKEYCDDVYTISGLSEPVTHIVGKFGKTCINGLECCNDCYDKICEFVCNLIVEK